MKTPDSEQPAGDDAWDDLFRQRLTDYTDQPPADALNRILTAANPPRPYRYRAMVSAIALLLLSVGGWFVLHPSASTVSPVAAVTRRPLPSAPLVTHSTGAAEERRDHRPVREATPVDGADVRSINKPATAPIRSEPHLAESRVLPGADGETDRRMATTEPDRAVPANITLGITPRSSAGLVALRPERSRASLPVKTTYAAAGPQGTGKNGRSRMGPPTSDIYSLSVGGRRGDSSVLPGEYRSSFPPITPQKPSAQLVAVPEQKRLDLMALRPFRAFDVTGQLPAVRMASDASTVPPAPESSRQRQPPSWFVSLTPLYNFQQIDPVHTDNEFVSNIQGARPLAADRLSGRLQAGLEWSLTRGLSLRTSVVYQQMRQSLHYAVRSVRPDSVQVVRVDDQSVQLTPHFTERSYAESTVWHYAGLSSDLVWQLNRGGRWQHYLTAGVTAGRYAGSQNTFSGFGQIAYGFERPLTTTVRLRVEPSLQVGWQALTDRSQRLQSRPYNYGLSLGLRFR